MKSYPPCSTSATSFDLEHALDRLLEQTRQRIADGVRSPALLEMQVSHRRHLLEHFGPVRLAELGEEAIEAYVATERGRTARGTNHGLSPRTIVKRLSTLRRALTLAKKRRELERLPEFPELSIPRYRSATTYLERYSDFEKLQKALPVHRAEWTALALWTLQRANDVDRMLWRDVSLTSSPPWMLVRSTKTGRPDGRKVRMPRPLLEVLRARARRLTREGRPPSAGDKLVDAFTNRAVLIPLVCARLGLPILTATSLRHTAVSWMIRRKGITKAAMELGGWSSYEMMCRVYGHALPAGLEDAIRELESVRSERRRAA